MKVVFISHPISGDVLTNLIEVENIVRDINLMEPNVVPCAPYYVDCVALDDDLPEERKRGINNSVELIKRGLYDEIRLYGHSGITDGMMREVMAAKSVKITIVAMTAETQEALFELECNLPDNTVIFSEV
jgi:hypothetical protein